MKSQIATMAFQLNINVRRKDNLRNSDKIQEFLKYNIIFLNVRNII